MQRTGNIIGSPSKRGETPRAPPPRRLNSDRWRVQGVSPRFRGGPGGGSPRSIYSAHYKFTTMCLYRKSNSPRGLRLPDPPISNREALTYTPYRAMRTVDPEIHPCFFSIPMRQVANCHVGSIHPAKAIRKHAISNLDLSKSILKQMIEALDKLWVP